MPSTTTTTVTTITAFLLGYTLSLLLPRPPEDGIDVVTTAILSRRSVFPKQYTPDEPPLPDATIHAILDSARWAPTHHLTEPWKFTVFAS